MIHRCRFLLSLAVSITLATSLQAEGTVKIVLVAGQVKEVDKVGHHDYLGGCRLMQVLLKQTPGVEAVLVRADGAVLATPGVQDRLTVLRAPGVGP